MLFISNLIGFTDIHEEIVREFNVRVEIPHLDQEQIDEFSDTRNQNTARNNNQPVQKRLRKNNITAKQANKTRIITKVMSKIWEIVFYRKLEPRLLSLIFLQLFRRIYIFATI